jgi:hypothetical protein
MGMGEGYRIREMGEKILGEEKMKHFLTGRGGGFVYSCEGRMMP